MFSRKFRVFINVGLIVLLNCIAASAVADVRQYNLTSHISHVGDDGYTSKELYISVPAGTVVTVSAGSYSYCTSSHAYCSNSVEIYSGNSYLTTNAYAGSSQSINQTIVSDGTIILVMESIVGYQGQFGGTFCAPSYLSHSQYTDGYNNWLNYVYADIPPEVINGELVYNENSFFPPDFPTALPDCSASGNVPDAAGASSDVVLSW